ncbi:MAG: hypothetical protein IT170_05550 [Bryobacterales bacterium]|nr:hypothetical protein [Bryobacterales bacterium]
MNRRHFLLSCGSLGAVNLAIADPPPIHTLDRLHLDVWIEYQVQKVEVTGWKVTVDEDISMDVLAWNEGPLGAKFGYAKPVRGDWRRIEEYFVGPGEKSKLVYRRKPDNEDMFFYAWLEDPSRPSTFPIVSGERGNSNAGIHDNHTRCEMSWTRPQELHLQVQRTP